MQMGKHPKRDRRVNRAFLSRESLKIERGGKFLKSEKTWMN